MERIRVEIIKSYGDDSSISTDYGKILNADNLNRLEKLIQDEKTSYAGNLNVKTRYLGHHFDAFIHIKAVLHRGQSMYPSPRYAPYSVKMETASKNPEMALKI